MIKALQFGLDARLQHLMVKFSHPHLKALIQSIEVYLSKIGDQMVLVIKLPKCWQDRIR
jgi:hypothetical protein